MSNNHRTSSCTSILIGKKATIDGSIIIGRNEDASASLPKHFIVHSRKEYKENPCFISKVNQFRLTLPKIRYKYTATPEWTDKEGKFEESGFNEFGVAMSATESTYTNATALGADPLVAEGIGEEAMVTCVLPYVKTARAAIERLGSIVEKYGTCESNGVLFADVKEAWYMEIVCGHQWLAQRIPDDCYAVIANQVAIQEVDFEDNYNFMFKDDLKEFVIDNQLNPQPDHFNFRLIFGTRGDFDEHYNTPRVWWGQQQFSDFDKEVQPTSEDLPFYLRPQRKLSIDDAKMYLSSHYQQTPYDLLNPKAQHHDFRPISLAKTQESHLLQIRNFDNQAIACLHWLALGVTAQSVYVPFYLGMKQTPVFYRKGKLPADFDSAYWLYKLVGVLVDAHYPELGSMLHDYQKKINVHLNQQVRQIDQQALEYSDQAMLTDFLTQQSAQMADYAAEQYRQLAAKLLTKATELSPLNFKTDLNL
ncbi:C69 family dipeptidase [Bombilactobacillus thymidiniphilus]|uniref:Dipeptidase n=1 Tax=Bombilactobacillus thymidiniphilus TaxID=2923363 RepID=A0ABY4PEC7_9LACO|nr:C69 family dipeptidase [Bombilactobacillus thymidiniphilus]UQS83859.1 C69 family dipeptidase [Bombilactobacillus thymidiniphilus]